MKQLCPPAQDVSRDPGGFGHVQLLAKLFQSAREERDILGGARQSRNLLASCLHGRTELGRRSFAIGVRVADDPQRLVNPAHLCFICRIRCARMCQGPQQSVHVPGGDHACETGQHLIVARKPLQGRCVRFSQRNLCVTASKVPEKTDRLPGFHELLLIGLTLSEPPHDGKVLPPLSKRGSKRPVAHLVPEIRRQAVDPQRGVLQIVQQPAGIGFRIFKPNCECPHQVAVVNAAPVILAQRVEQANERIDEPGLVSRRPREFLKIPRGDVDALGIDPTALLGENLQYLASGNEFSAGGQEWQRVRAFPPIGALGHTAQLRR